MKILTLFFCALLISFSTLGQNITAVKSTDAEKIYSVREVAEVPAYLDNYGRKLKLSTFLFDELKTKLELLDDGEYYVDIKDPVVDKNGRITCNNYIGLKQITREKVSSINTTTNNSTATWTRTTPVTGTNNIPVKTKAVIDLAAKQMLDSFPTVRCAQLHGMPVNVTGYFFATNSYIVVKDHKATLKQDFFSL